MLDLPLIKVLLTAPRFGPRIMVYPSALTYALPIALLILIYVYVNSQWWYGDRILYWTPQHWTNKFVLDNDIEYWTYDTLPTIIYEVDIDTIQHVNEIIDNNILIWRTFLLLQDENAKFIHTQVKARAAHFDQEQAIFLVSLGEGRYTDIMLYSDIIKRLYTQLKSESEIED